MYINLLFNENWKADKHKLLFSLQDLFKCMNTYLCIYFFDLIKLESFGRKLIYKKKKLSMFFLFLP